ncbi:MAG: Methionyl-tRNA synthetase [Myxococcales bacterium]|nr:Methionyl-tRNA synthetase [Myxococcales bacterium]
MSFYITTPIYYVSDVPHIGHAYTTIVCDTLARYHRLRGHKTGFLSGTDEHGLKIARMAEERGMQPKAYADKIAEAYRSSWKALEISNDDFIRTTDADHEALVQELWKTLEKNGDIYLGHYEGWYCVPCEQFYTEKELVDGNCQVHKKPVEKVREESYYFRLSKYQDALLQHIDANPRFILPESRKNEVRAFIAQGLDDLSVSRTSFTWGVPVPGRDNHVIYVWIDALSNYWTATRRKTQLEGLWDEGVEVVHMIGKEISRFHAVFWPAILMAAGIRLPTTVFCHGWWTVDGEKMSKTAGNVIDPLKLASDISVDALRYFVLREVPLGADGDFNHEAFLQRYNSELANDLGNLVNRTLGMVTKYALTPASASTSPFNLAAAFDAYARALDDFQPSKALEALWALVREGNTYIDQKAPWKPESPRVEILGNVLELCRVLSHLLEPFMPERALAMRDQLGVDEPTAWPAWQPRSFSPRVGTPLFPRVEEDRKKELLERWRPHKKAAAAVEEKADGLISFEEFGKLDLRVAEVVAAEAVPKAKKLLKLTVDLGGERRQVVAGIAGAYEPSALIGRKVIFVANLKPATIRGVESQGMILAAGEAEILGLSALDRDVPAGTKVR